MTAVLPGAVIPLTTAAPPTAAFPAAAAVPATPVKVALPAAAVSPATAVPPTATVPAAAVPAAVPAAANSQAASLTSAATSVTTVATTTTTTTTIVALRLPASPVNSADLAPGLAAQRFYQSAGRAEVIAIDSRLYHWNRFMLEVTLRWQGFLHIRLPGLYVFRTICSGFSQLTMDSYVLLRSPSRAYNTTNQTQPIYMEVGFHPFSVVFSQHDGPAGVILHYAGPDTANNLLVVGSDALYHLRGPCVLNRIPQAVEPPCPGPRWALGNGESCSLQCKDGYFANGLVNSSNHQVMCSAGSLSSPDARCELLRCSAPAVANSSSISCKEGPLVESAGQCTPACLPGFRVQVVEGELSCYNGTLQGSFLCIEMRGCKPPVGLANAADEPCLGRSISVLHGETCIANCAPGFVPDVANLTCQDGLLQPMTFGCFWAPTTPVATTSEDVFAKSFGGMYDTTTPEPDSGVSWSQWIPLLAIPVFGGIGGYLLYSAFGVASQDKVRRPPRYVAYSDEEDGSEERLTRGQSRSSNSTSSSSSPATSPSRRGAAHGGSSMQQYGSPSLPDFELELALVESRRSAPALEPDPDVRDVWPSEAAPAYDGAGGWPQAGPGGARDLQVPPASLLDSALPDFPASSSSSSEASAERRGAAAFAASAPPRETWGSDDGWRRQRGTLDVSEDFMSMRPGGSGGSALGAALAMGSLRPAGQALSEAPSSSSLPPRDSAPPTPQREAMRWSAPTRMTLETSTTLQGRSTRPASSARPESQVVGGDSPDRASASHPEKIRGSSWQPLGEGSGRYPPGSQGSRGARGHTDGRPRAHGHQAPPGSGPWGEGQFHS